MARVAMASDNDYIKLWQEYCESFRKSATIDSTETQTQKIRRIKRLEDDQEEWFKYYFPNYCSSEPADFHRKATKRLMNNDEWYEVRAWSRELAKTARAMMEICYLAMRRCVRNVLIVTNTGKNAERMLLPFKSFFESNPRLINDYGNQQKLGAWTSSEFKIRRGCSFRGLGWGESPRGTRQENVRPDFILIDDIDTDEECRNEDIMKNKLNWIEQALIGTRSISEPLRILVNGNIIHDNCVVKKLGEKADHFSIINIRDKNGKSTWVSKNTEEMIDRTLSLISYESAQKEYFNNPMDGTDTFKNIQDGKVPNLRKCNIAIYADPSTSNKDVSSGSDKAVGIVAQHGFDYYIVKVFLDTMSNARFIDALFECYLYLKRKGLDNFPIYIENNSLQNPFFEQVLQPMIYQKAIDTKVFLPITPDDRPKIEKWTRIEGTLEPIFRLGHFYFNEAEKDNPHMQRLKAQFKNASRKQKKMDGADMVQGAVTKLKEREMLDATGGIEVIQTRHAKRWDS